MPDPAGPRPRRVDMHWDMHRVAEPGQTGTNRAVGHARAKWAGREPRPGGLRLMPRPGSPLLAASSANCPRRLRCPASRSRSRGLVGGSPPADQQSAYDSSAATSGRFRTRSARWKRFWRNPVRGGQIVANARDRTASGTAPARRSGRHRGGPLDRPSQPTADGDEYLTVAPADSARIATQVTELLNQLVR